MRVIKQKMVIAAAMLTILSACSTTQEKVEQEVSYLNQYPTRDRVEYVLQCVAKHGGLTYINQYACGCKIDKIAEKLTFEEYEAATTYGFMRKTPGEKGGAFRDPKESKSLKKRLEEAEAYAERMCFVK
ncbi:hypothetical protein Q9L42_015550 [Methylomarinum sp. Ch1-1]|uniref:Lipoprotein n=1 Tax=Methylomarinum roseum TaxID=3067653 RepID=A0AAU7NRY0_9GAMM|nr:hypothetical protein [Methylomarinum sp. Ch1-1]MDP4520248.1 hypothetical protein [Methylomarinum sp. Ch1-1]